MINWLLKLIANIARFCLRWHGFLFLHVIRPICSALRSKAYNSVYLIVHALQCWPSVFTSYTIWQVNFQNAVALSCALLGEQKIAISRMHLQLHRSEYCADSDELKEKKPKLTAAIVIAILQLDVLRHSDRTGVGTWYVPLLARIIKLQIWTILLHLYH